MRCPGNISLWEGCGANTFRTIGDELAPRAILENSVESCQGYPVALGLELGQDFAPTHRSRVGSEDRENGFYRPRRDARHAKCPGERGLPLASPVSQVGIMQRAVVTNWNRSRSSIRRWACRTTENRRTLNDDLVSESSPSSRGFRRSVD